MHALAIRENNHILGLRAPVLENAYFVTLRKAVVLLEMLEFCTTGNFVRMILLMCKFNHALQVFATFQARAVLDSRNKGFVVFGLTNINSLDGFKMCCRIIRSNKTHYC